MTEGVIAAGDPQTAAAGAEVLRAGGNAADAAVAACFAAFAAEWPICNPGGGGVAVVNDGSGATAYDFWLRMPGLGESSPPRGPDFREVMVDFGPTQYPFHIGRASVAVPGVVAGLCAVAGEKGSMPLSDLLAPAIRLARRGAVLSDALAYVAHILTPIFTDTPGLAAMYSPGGKYPTAGDRVPLPELADTFEHLASEGRSLFYTGEIGRMIVGDQQANGGLVTAEDLFSYSVSRVPPISFRHGEHTILLPPPSSVGGALIAFTLKLLNRAGAGGFRHSSCGHVRLLAEACRLTNVARPAWERLKGMGEEGAERFLSDGHMEAYHRSLADILAGAAPPTEPPALEPPGGTTHISVMDEHGLGVSLTTSTGECAGFVLPGTGVTLNNCLGEKDLHPAGFHSLPPGESLPTMMSPSIVLKDGVPVMTVGSGGSSRIRSAMVQVISNVLDFGMPLDAAVTAPRVHFEDDVLQLEGGYLPETARELEKAGYTLNLWPGRNMYFGGAHAVAVQGGEMVAVGDARRGGAVEVVR